MKKRKLFEENEKMPTKNQTKLFEEKKMTKERRLYWIDRILKKLKR